MATFKTTPKPDSCTATSQHHAETRAFHDPPDRKTNTMSTPKPRRRRMRLILLVLLNCGAVAGGTLWIQYMRSPGYQRKQAAGAIQRQAWPTAEIYLKNVIATDPDDADMRLALANVYRQLADKAAASSDAKADAGALKSGDGDAEPDGGDDKADAGNSKPRNVDPPLAVEQLIEVARLRPEDTAVRLRLLTTYTALGKTEAAVQMAQELAALGTEQPNVLELAVRAALDAKQWDEAESLLERMKASRIEISPVDAVMAIHLYEGRGDTEKIDPLLRPLVLDLLRKQSVQLTGVTEAELRTIAYLLRASVRWAPDGVIASQRFNQSLGFLREMAKTPFGKSRRADLVEIGAQLLAVAKPPSPEMRDKRQFANEEFYKFAEPILDAKQASPLVYEQLSRAAAYSKDPTRALSILRRGIDQHRQLPPERQRELLALHGQAVQLLLGQSRFAEAQANLGVLLAHPETAPLGNLLAAAVALEEGRLEDAGRHASLAATADGDPTAVDSLLVRVHLAKHEWQPALDVLEALDCRWEIASAAEAQRLSVIMGGRDQVHLLQARCFVQLGQPERSEALLQQLERGPLRAQVCHLRVVIALQQGRRREAWDLLRTARREFPGDRQLVWIEFSLLVDEKAPEGATRLLAGHIRQFPQDLSSRLLITQYLLQRGETRSTLQQLAEIRHLFPNLTTGWLLTSDVLLNTGQGPELDALLKEMARQPDVAHLIPLIQASRSLRMAGLNEADAALRQVNPELQRTAGFNVISAAVSLAQGKAELAFDQFANSLRFAGNRDQVRNGFLRAFEQSLRTADPAKLGQQVEELRKQFPDEPAVLLASAEMTARRGDFKSALERVDRLAQVDPMPGRPGYIRARLLAVQGQRAEALAELHRVFEKVPQHSAAHLLAAQLAFMQGDAATALTHLDAIPQVEATEPLPTLLRAEVLAKLNRDKEAEELLNQLTLRQPQFSPGWLALSSLHSAGGRTAAGITTLEAGLKQAADPRLLQNSLIELLLRSKQTGRAVAAVQRFSEGSSDPGLGLRWAKLFLDAGQFQAADDWLKQARQHVKPPSDDLLFLEALALHQRAIDERSDRLFQEARVRYGKLLEQSPRHVPAMNNLAWLLLRQFDQPAEALAVVEQLRIAIPVERMTPHLLDTVIDTYQRSGRHAEALELATQSVERFPESGILRLQYGAVLIEGAGGNLEQRELARKQLTLASARGLPPERQQELTALMGDLNPAPKSK